MDLFDKYGAYNYTSFIGSNGIWKLTGSATNFSNIKVPYINGISEEILKILDTFANSKGVFKEIPRFQIMIEAQKGFIKPVEESLVKLPTMSSKEWNKKIVRSI